MKGLLITLGIVLVLGIGFAVWAIGVSNQEKKLYLSGKAMEKSCQNNFDNMWKTIQQEAGVTEQYKDGFKEVYAEMLSARYDADKGAGQQTLMKWIQESNPTFDSNLFGKLMNTIEGKREGFKIAQDQLIDIDRQHKAMRVTFPNSLIIGSRPDLEITIVTSAKTEEVYKTGQDNDVELFKKDNDKTKV